MCVLCRGGALSYRVVLPVYPIVTRSTGSNVDMKNLCNSGQQLLLEVQTKVREAVPESLSSNIVDIQVNK